MGRAMVLGIAAWLSFVPAFAQERTAPAAPSASDGSSIERLNAALRDDWARHQIQPAPPADDLIFLRRVWLDLGGRIPDIQATRAALDARTPLDRAALVERLLASDEFANHWGRMWAEYLTDTRPFEEGTHNGRLLQNYLRDALQRNERYDDLVRTLFQAEGFSDTSGPVNFLLRYGVQPTALTGAAADKFLGVTLKCAECHDHPHSTWTQDDFWGLAAYFARLKQMTPADGSGQFSSVIERQRGELEVPDRDAMPDENGEYPARTIFPRLPGAETIDTTTSRREAFLAWLTAGDNPYFARQAVNRVWEMLLGRPLVAGFDPPEDGAAPQESAVLDALAADFAEHDFDLHRLIRTIVLSDAYQRAAGATADDLERIDNAAAQSAVEHFASYAVRPLSADQLHLSLLIATGSVGDPNDSRLAQVTGEEYTYDIAVGTFSGPAMTPRRALALLNGERAREAVSLASQAAIRQFGPSPGAAHIDWLFLSLLSRPPRPAERDELLKLVGAASGETGLEDAVWVLVNSAEFNSNH